MAVAALQAPQLLVPPAASGSIPGAADAWVRVMLGCVAAAYVRAAGMCLHIKVGRLDVAAMAAGHVGSGPGMKLEPPAPWNQSVSNSLRVIGRALDRALRFYRRAHRACVMSH